MLQVLAVFQVLLSAVLIALILMHSGRDTGFGGLGFTPAKLLEYLASGVPIMIPPLPRRSFLKLSAAIIFGINTVALFYQFD